MEISNFKVCEEQNPLFITGYASGMYRDALDLSFLFREKINYRRIEGSNDLNHFERKTSTFLKTILRHMRLW